MIIEFFVSFVYWNALEFWALSLLFSTLYDPNFLTGHRNILDLMIVRLWIWILVLLVRYPHFHQISSNSGVWLPGTWVYQTLDYQNWQNFQGGNDVPESFKSYHFHLFTLWAQECSRFSLLYIHLYIKKFTSFLKSSYKYILKLWVPSDVILYNTF